MLFQLRRFVQKRPGHFVGTPAAVFTFPGPAGSLWRARLSGAFPGFTKFSQDRTETRIKLKVQGGQVAHSPAKQFFSLRPWGPLRNSRSWPVLATASRRDWFAKNPNRFCRSFHLSRNGGIAHLEATATCFLFPWQIGWKSGMKQKSSYSF